MNVEKETSNSQIIDNKEITLKVLTIDDNKFNVAIQINQTIKDFKSKLESISEVPWNMQRLIYKGKLLENEKKIIDYSMSNEDVIHFIAKLNSEEPNDNSSNSNPLNDNINTENNNNTFRSGIGVRGFASLGRGLNSINFLPIINPIRRRRLYRSSNPGN